MAKLNDHRGRLYVALPGLQAVREDRGLTLRELGELSGVHYVNISKIERRQQMALMSSLEKLAIALKVESLEELLRDPEEREGAEEQEGELVAT